MSGHCRGNTKQERDRDRDGQKQKEESKLFNVWLPLAPFLAPVKFKPECSRDTQLSLTYYSKFEIAREAQMQG